jgi:phospholipid/cholesterol/gamma-HCH transport system substrate-binding protein
MRSRWNLPIYIVYLAFSLLVIGFIVAQIGVQAPWTHQYSVTANFSDAADILVNNEVYMDGVRVGRVGDVTVVNRQAHVTLVIDDTHALPLHTDATAGVRKKNLLGETYIDLQRGTASGEMADGGNIPVSRTVPITAIDQVLAIFDPETVQRLQLLINALGDATTNNGQNMNAEAASTNQLLNALNAPALTLSVRRQQVQDIVLELQKFYSVLATQRTQVRDEFGTWNQVMAQMASQEASIGGTLQQADKLLTNVDTLVAGQGGNLHNVLANLPATLDAANAFLDQSNAITADLAPYRQYINDIFPVLQTAFADTGATGQHVLEALSINCRGDALSNLCAGDVPSALSPNASGDVWAVLASAGAGR